MKTRHFPLLALSTWALGLFFSNSVLAGLTSKLWSERQTGSAPLAQVPDFRTLAEQVVPAVVSIQVEQKVQSSASRMGPGGMPQDPLEFFHRYFGGEVPREYRNRGLGTGFVIDATGLILTNFHVVEDADRIEVTVSLPDGSEKKVTAKTLGTAPEYDVALLQADQALGGSVVAFLGDSETTQIGDWVMAVGNPFGLSHSVSVGIISAKERRDIAPSGRHGLYNFLQTDASINPGNSGGPLVNMRGEVIGINSAINAAGAGIGFAIPINMVKEMLPDLKATGRYARSWLGIKIQPLTDELAESYGLKRTNGALIADVVDGGPAAKAGLREGDVVLAFGGKTLRSTSDLPLFASMAGVGKHVLLKVWRDNKEVLVNVTMMAFPADDASAIGPVGQNGAPAADLGMVVVDLTQPLLQHLGLDNVHGVLIKELTEDGPAARAGLRPRDIITHVGRHPIPDARTLSGVLGHVRPGQMVRLKVQRGPMGLFVALQRPKK